MTYGASNPTLPRIIADVTSLPAFTHAMSVEWSAAAKMLPPGATLANATSLEPSRMIALVSGAEPATRSEAAMIDCALATNASRFLPAPRCATISQRAEPVRIEFLSSSTAPRYLPDERPREVSRPKKTPGARRRPGHLGRKDAHAERAARWLALLEKSGLSMPQIARRSGVDYRCVKSILRSGSLGTLQEVDALERVVGR